MLEMSPASEPWNFGQQFLRAKTGDTASDLSALPEPVSAILVGELLECGLRIVPRDEMSDAALRRASGLLQRIPSLHDVVCEQVKGVIRLGSDDPAVDMGHSQPRWSGLVFVSFPPPSDVGDIRLVEGVVHEAMHINLTNTGLENLLYEPNSLVYSPWRETLRPASGVLHGAYVFTCLFRFFQLLVETQSLTSAQTRHVMRRQSEILREFHALPREELSSAVGEAGRGLCEWMLDYVGDRISLDADY